MAADEDQLHVTHVNPPEGGNEYLEGAGDNPIRPNGNGQASNKGMEDLENLALLMLEAMLNNIQSNNKKRSDSRDNIQSLELESD